MSRLSPALVRRLVVGLLVAGLVAAWVSQPGADRMELTAEFDRAGLSVRAGDEVRLRGVPVGRISSIEIDRENFTATYRLSVDPSAPVAADTGASLVPKTLFGEKFVSLDAADGGPRAKDGLAIPLARTSAPTEIQEVLDRLQPVLAEVDPIAFSSTLDSLAEGLDGHADDLATVIDALPPALETLISNQQDLGRIFRSVPGVAGTLQERSDQLLTAADAFGELAVTIDRNEGELRRFVTDTAQLSTRAAELLDDEETRIARILDDGLSVLEIVDDNRGALTTLLQGAPRFVGGLKAATATGAFRAPIANFAVLNPGSLLDGKGEFSEGRGGAGIGPDVEVEGFPLEDGVDVGSGADAPPDPSTETVNGAAGLLDNLLGGER